MIRRVRLTSRVDLALRAGVELAAVEAAASGPGQGQPVLPGQELARRLEASYGFLVAVLGQLRDHGLVASVRGRDGELILARPATAITLADVIRAVDGPLALIAGDHPEDQRVRRGGRPRRRLVRPAPRQAPGGAGAGGAGGRRCPPAGGGAGVGGGGARRGHPGPRTVALKRALATHGGVDNRVAGRWQDARVSSPPPTADVSVRLAWATDVEALARVQVRALTAYGEALPGIDEAGAVDAVAAAWREAVVRPPTARHRVLVALAGGEVVGLAAVAPNDDRDAEPGVDGEVAAFHVDPRRTREGHGSRLLAACVDTLRADGFRRATIWVVVGDDAVLTFLGRAGWAPDGAHRRLDREDGSGRELHLVRLHTDVTEDPA